VIIRKGFESLEEASETEEDLLDKAWGLEQTSRLSCQTKLNSEDLEIELPKYNINQVSENH
jgi:2Fe-2S ferredoxin